MPYTADAKNEMLDALSVTHVSAHTADPSTTGTNEVSGGSYARQSITFAAAAAGSMASSNTPAIPIPTGVTVTHLGYWSASSGGTFLGSSDITDDTFVTDGTLTVTSATLDLNA